MKGFYEITQQLKDSLIAEPFVNTVTFGNIDDIDLDKQNIFPLSHIIIRNLFIRFKMECVKEKIIGFIY